MKNDGFTLVEVLTVIVVLALVMLIAIPSVIAIQNRLQENMLNTKINFAVGQARLMGIDNKEHFNAPTCRNNVGSSDETGLKDCKCNEEGGSWQNKTCNITLHSLAEQKFLEWDNEAEKKLINPQNTSNCINFWEVKIIYVRASKVFQTEIDPASKTNHTCP